MRESDELGKVGKTFAYLFGIFMSLIFSTVISGIIFGLIILYIEKSKRVKVEGTLEDVILILWGIVSIIIFIIFIKVNFIEKKDKSKVDGEKNN